MAGGKDGVCRVIYAVIDGLCGIHIRVLELIEIGQRDGRGAGDEGRRSLGVV